MITDDQIERAATALYSYKTGRSALLFKTAAEAERDAYRAQARVVLEAGEPHDEARDVVESPQQTGVVPPLVFVYRNHRGAVERRGVMPFRFVYGTTEWHPEPQWLLVARDLDRGAERSFAFRDIVPDAQRALQTINAMPDL